MWEGFGGKRGEGIGALVLSRPRFGQIFESRCGAWGGREGGRESGRVADVGRLLGEAWCGDRSSGLVPSPFLDKFLKVGVGRGEGGRESGRVADVGRLLGEAWCGDRSSGLVPSPLKKKKT